MKKASNLILGLIITLFIILGIGIAQAETIVGKARVIDGDTIEINGEKIRLACIDAPESNYRGKTQYCLDNETKCGELAKQALQNMIGDDEVVCEYEKKDFYGRILAHCYPYKLDKNGKTYYDNRYNGKYYFGINEYNIRLLDDGYAWFYNGGKDCRDYFYKDVFKVASYNGEGLFDKDLGGFKEPRLWRKALTNDE